MKFPTKRALKRGIKLIVSLGFFIATFIWNFVRRMGGKKEPGTCVVLYYHSVAPQYRAQFARQMDMLRRCATPIRADRKSALDRGVHYAVITFDDGIQSIVENALPELKKRDIPSTFFIVTEALERQPTWLTEPAACNSEEKVISVDQLRKLPSDLVTIGSHSITHRRLTYLEEREAKRELAESRTKLEKMLNEEVRLFSFPYGDFNKRLVVWCRESGYHRVFTISPTLAFSNPQEFVTGRIEIEATDWPMEFRLKVLGAYRWLPLAFALKQKILSSSLLNRILRGRGRSRETTRLYAAPRE